MRRFPGFLIRKVGGTAFKPIQKQRMNDRPRTRAADAYVEIQRRKKPVEATWFDVAAAYDAGMRHAILNRASARYHFDQVEWPRRIDTSKPEGKQP